MSDQLGENQEQGFIDHLMELRDRLLRIVLYVLVCFLLLFSFANDLYHYLSLPVISNLPEGSQMIATGIISPFATPLKLALVMSFYLAMPGIIFEIWAFVAPGLYRHEKKLALPLIVSSAALFYVGMFFAYYVVVPNVIKFMTAFVPEGIVHTPDITFYLDFMLKMFFAFGLAFEVPVATVLLVLSGITSPQDLAAKRAYIIVGAFVFGMLLTPPDPMSQIALAIPMWLLFELGLIASRMVYKDKNESTGEDEEYKPLSEDEMDAELDRMEMEDEPTDKD
jgi:sec-independent protein translocase protein TatC